MPTSTSDVPMYPQNEMIVARTLARIALIRLHCKHKEREQRSRDACIAAADAALAVVRDMNLGSVVCVDPIMAVCTRVCFSTSLADLIRVVSFYTDLAVDHGASLPLRNHSCQSDHGCCARCHSLRLVQRPLLEHAGNVCATHHCDPDGSWQELSSHGSVSLQP